MSAEATGTYERDHRRYVAKFPAASAAVNWTALVRLESETATAADVDLGVNKRKRVDHPENGPHDNCTTYAEHISEKVFAADRHLFRSFNYTTCC